MCSENMKIVCKMCSFQAVCFLKVKNEKRKKYLLETKSPLLSDHTSFRGSLSKREFKVLNASLNGGWFGLYGETRENFK